jgi:hypothetical protein
VNASGRGVGHTLRFYELGLPESPHEHTKIDCENPTPAAEDGGPRIWDRPFGSHRSLPEIIKDLLRRVAQVTLDRQSLAYSEITEAVSEREGCGSEFGSNVEET